MTIELEHFPTSAVTSVDHLVADIVQTIAGRGARPMDVEQVRDLVVAELLRYRDARVRTFIPVLVRRSVLDVLQGRGPSAGAAQTQAS